MLHLTWLVTVADSIFLLCVHGWMERSHSHEYNIKMLSQHFTCYVPRNLSQQKYIQLPWMFFDQCVWQYVHNIEECSLLIYISSIEGIEGCVWIYATTHLHLFLALDECPLYIMWSCQKMCCVYTYFKSLLIRKFFKHTYVYDCFLFTITSAGYWQAYCFLLQLR